MYNKLISKMKSHFGDESLIMFSKSCDYYQVNPIKKEDVQMYYEYLMSDYQNNNPDKKILNDLSCCLYYLSKNNKEYEDKFTSQIIEKIDINNDAINDDLLILIYNIIEFDEQYLKSDKIKLEYLLNYLERFSTHPKSRTNFLLYKYYRGCLKLNLGDLVIANSEYLEIVMAYTDEIINAQKENKYTLFIKLKNDLLNVRITKISMGDDIHQTRIFLKELYDRTKNENQFLAIKIGFELYDIYLKENKYFDCIYILMNMRTILKKRLLTGIKINCAIDFYMAIVSRLGYIGILTNNKASIENSIKKLTKSIDMFNKNTDENKDKSNIFKNAYSFLLMLLKINNYEKVDKQKEIAANFKSFFIPDLKLAQANKFKGQFIINESNFFDCIVNLNIINSQDYDVDSFLKKEIYLPMLNTVAQNNPLENKYVMTFILTMHNLINHFTEIYCTEEYNNKDKYKKKINELCETTITYIRNYGVDSVIVHTQFIKSCIINIISTYANLLLNNKEFNQLKNLVKFIDDLSKSLKFSDSTPSFELIYKIKGDFWLFNTLKDINASITFYDKALKIMANYHPKRPVILFNIGYCYYENKDKRKSVDYLNRCINEFNNIEQNRSPFEFYYRANAMNQKVKIAKKIVNLLSSGQ